MTELQDAMYPRTPPEPPLVVCPECGDMVEWYDMTRMGVCWECKRKLFEREEHGNDD